MRAGFMSFDARFKTAAIKLAAAGLALTAVLAFAAPPVIRVCASLGGLRHVAALAALAVLGAVVYGGAVFAMFGSQWIAGLRRRRARPAL
jgi:putative peptidoglycan lipid II flippase